MDRVGYESRNFLTGSGLFLLVIASFIPIVILTLLLGAMTKFKHKCFARLFTKWRNFFFWNFYFRALLESSLEISLLASMDIHLRNLFNGGYICSFTLSIIMLTALLSFMFWIRLWLSMQDLKDN